MKYEHRRKMLTNGIPDSYPYLIHAILPSSIFLICLICSISYMEHFSFITFILTLFGLFGFEWLVHKSVLHKPFKFLKFIYHQHATHHIVYTDFDMGIRDYKELKIVLVPVKAFIITLLLTLSFTTILNLIFGANVAFTLLATISLFFIVYEFLHLSYHLPNTFIGKTRIIQMLKEHHRIHHTPKLMRNFNLNVTIPVFDYILKTKIAK